MEVKHPIRAAVRLLTLLIPFLAVSFSSHVHAQNTILRAPATYHAPQTKMRRVKPTSAVRHASTSAECVECPQPNYWIVSSRHCNSRRQRYCSRCALSFHHVGADRRERKADQETFLAELIPNAPVCILVHGSFGTWDSVRTGSAELYDWLRASAPNQPANFVFFTWPSDQPSTMLFQIDMAILGRRSADHGLHLSEFISLIPEEHPISLVGHSHGVRTIAAAMHLRSGGEVQGVRTGMAADIGRRIRMVFAAAAIDNHWLNPGERYGLALRGTERLVNLTNYDDIALSLYPFRRPFSHSALARTGFTLKNRIALGHWTSKLAELDVTPIIKRGHFWHNYVEHPEIARSIAPTLFFLDSPKPQLANAPQQRVRQMSGTNPTNTGRAKPLRETFSNIGRTQPASRM